MTKEEFKQKYIESSLLTWENVGDIDFEYMYHHLHLIDSAVAQLFKVPIEMVISKRVELGTVIKEDDYTTFLAYKQQGYLKWDELNYNRFYYLYNKCNFADSVIAELFDVPKKTVTMKRKELGISVFDNLFPGDIGTNVSSYLDFMYTD